MAKFETKPSAPRRRAHGTASTLFVDPSSIADKVFGASISGPWLCCYMLRRFGWPNIGSDDYKDLCAWCLATPIDGLYLSVRPYMGDAGGELDPRGVSNLHFGLIYTDEVGIGLHRELEVERHWQRVEKAIRRWWDREGSSLYVFTEGDPQEDELAHKWNDVDGKIVGLWRRPDGFKKLRSLPRVPRSIGITFWWWISEFMKKKHPGIVPKSKPLTGRPSAFQRRACRAIESALRDLLRPTYVRDVHFSPLGHTDDGRVAEPFDGAGCTPEYWYSARRKRQERKTKEPA